MFDVFAMIVVRSIRCLPVLESFDFGELCENLHNLICSFTAGSNNNHIGFSLFEIACCKYCFSATERTGIKPVPPSTIGLRVSITLTTGFK
jgi:hypothetical protein